MRLLRVATCNLNQWAMDFDTNLRNVKESIARAKAAGAAVRVGPELELTGYGCEDHFLEQDTTAHAYAVSSRLPLSSRLVFSRLDPHESYGIGAT
jgi:NAD+ synthase (glutamine-hydrolysing)